MNILNKILNMIYPDNFKCVFCKNEISVEKPPYVCEQCSRQLPFIKGKTCQRCGCSIITMSDYCMNCKNNVRYFNIARAPFEYSGTILSAIHSFKYNNAKYLFQSLAYYMAECYKHNNIVADFIIPVPSSKKRLKQRGYNQVELMGKELSKLIHIPMLTEVLIKANDTKPQTELNYFERQRNLEGSFIINNKKQIENKNILLIDDVLTTGATINCCSEILLENKAKTVYVLTLARTRGETFQKNKKTLANNKKK